MCHEFWPHLPSNPLPGSTALKKKWWKLIILPLNYLQKSHPQLLNEWQYYELNISWSIFKVFAVVADMYTYNSMCTKELAPD